MSAARGRPDELPTGSAEAAGSAEAGKEHPAEAAQVTQQRPAEAARKPLDPFQFITAVGSPVALGTALLFYFGWVRSEWQARAFGADASVFAMSTEDFVLRSVRALFFPVILLLLLGLLGLRLDRALISAAASEPDQEGASTRRSAWIVRVARVLRFSWAALLPLGVVLVLIAGEFGYVTLPTWVALAILGPAYGAVLRRRVTSDRRPSPRGVVAILATLLIVTLFWQTERLARLGGEAEAQDIKDRMSKTLETVTVFSAKNLHIAAPGVTTTDFGDPDAAYRFRYDGFYLLQRSGNKYFLVTDGWNDGRGRLIVAPDNDSIRLEFGP